MLKCCGIVAPPGDERVCSQKAIDSGGFAMLDLKIIMIIAFCRITLRKLAYMTIEKQKTCQTF